MSSQLPILDSPWVEQIGWSLVHSTWQIAVVAMAFVVLRYALRRRLASTRYLCGCLALLAMVAWPVATIVSYSGKQPTLTAQLSPPKSPSAVAEPKLPTAPPSDIRPSEPAPADEEFVSPSKTVLEAESTNAFMRVLTSDWRETLNPIVPWLTFAWLIGVSTLAIRPLWGLWTVQRLKTRGLVPLETKIRRLAGELMVRMRVHDAVQFAESSLVEVPTVVGYFRPMVLLPASALSGLSVEQLELVLAHELAHIRRHDFLVSLAQTVVESLLFYHPAVWWVSREVRRERENCCDDVVTELCGNREEYARALYALETHRQVAVPALAANGGSLAARIRRLLGRPQAPAGFERSIPWAAGLIVLLLISALLALGPAIAGENSGDNSIKPESAATTADKQSNSPKAEKLASGLEIDGVDVDEILAKLATYQSCPNKELLREKFIAAVRDTRRRHQGHVIVGRLLMEQNDSPTETFAQMEILPGGYFAGPTKDLENPVGFRHHGYAPYDLELQGSHGKVIDVGELQMKRLEPADLVPLAGQVQLADSENLAEVSVTLSVTNAPINTPSNGYEPRSDWPAPPKVSLDERGKFQQISLSPITYNLFASAPGYVPQRRRLEIEPGKPYDVGTLTLERPRRIRLDAIKAKQAPFKVSDTKVDMLEGGARWNVTQKRGRWDLEFDQRGNRLYVDWSYGPVFLADLGPGELNDFLRVEPGTAREQPHNMEVNNGHVYLLRRPDHERNNRGEHLVLFKVQIAGDQAAEPAASELTPVAATEPPQQRKRWIAVGRVTNDEGVPMPGVEISAACGVGSLFPTGSTTTDADGKYRLAFGPGIHLASDIDALQAATITASKPGYFEQNLCRQGNCLAGERLPAEAEENWDGDKDRVFLPGIPKTLDFVMQRAAILEGTFSETSSNGFVREQSFYLAGTELPPSSSVLTSAASDANGRFRIDGIPTGREWRIGMRVPHTWIEIETEPFKFDQPGIYRGRLLLNSTSGSDGVKMSLRFADLEQVATADQTREIDALDAEGFSKLHRAASGGHVERIRTLLGEGANVDVEQGTYHGTPLQYAAAQGHGETVQALLEHRATVDARDTRGRTPLLWAASNGHADVVRRLLDAGADINAAANGGWTALHFAVDRGHTEVAQLLIDRGADLRLKNSNGATPFDLNPKLDLRIPWQSLQQTADTSRVAGAGRPPMLQPVRRDERPLPDHPPDLVVATFRNEPIHWRDLTPPLEWYKQRAVYLQQHGHTLGFDTPDAYVMARLRSKIQSPLFEAYIEEHGLAVTKAEIAEFRKHYQTAKVAREREAGQPVAILNQTPEQEAFFAKWYVGNWKLQASLFHKYGGRAIYQQVGPEAIDAMRDFLKENETNDVFTIRDPQLRQQFWEPFTRENPGVLIPEPAKVFAHPWSPLE